MFALVCVCLCVCCVEGGRGGGVESPTLFMTLDITLQAAQVQLSHNIPTRAHSTPHATTCLSRVFVQQSRVLSSIPVAGSRWLLHRQRAARVSLYSLLVCAMRCELCNAAACSDMEALWL